MKNNSLFFVFFAIALFSALPASATHPLLFNFEKDTEGWATDWGIEDPLHQVTKYAAKGSGSLAFEHHFKKAQESVGLRVPLDNPIDFSSYPTFKGFSAWVYFPKGNDWEAQIYVATGSEWNMSWGELQRNLKAGWHKIFIREAEISDPSVVQAIGIQIKNYRLNTKSTIYIDYVQAEY